MKLKSRISLRRMVDCNVLIACALTSSNVLATVYELDKITVSDFRGPNHSVHHCVLSENQLTKALWDLDRSTLLEHSAAIRMDNRKIGNFVSDTNIKGVQHPELEKGKNFVNYWLSINNGAAILLRSRTESGTVLIEDPAKSAQFLISLIEGACR